MQKLLSTVKLTVDSGVMVMRNISVSDGLVNKAMKIVEQLKWAALLSAQIEDGWLPDCVLMKVDDDTTGSRLKDEDGCVEITYAVASD